MRSRKISIALGSTALTRIDAGANSITNARVSANKPPLLAEKAAVYAEAAP